MNTPSWMMQTVHRATHSRLGASQPRPPTSDRRLTLETILAVGVVLAWAWGVYELTLLFLRWISR